MSLKDTSLSLFQRVRLKISEHMLLVQGSTFLLTVVLSMMVCLPLGNVTSNFDGRCLLGSVLYIKVQNYSLQYPAQLDLARTQLGTDCDYPTFLSATVAVSGIIFIWFIVHFSRITDFQWSESGFLLSVLLLNLVLLVCVLLSSLQISTGFSSWCQNIFTCGTSQISPRKCKKMDCRRFSEVTWQDNKGDTSSFYSYFLLAEVSSWLLALTLLFDCVITAERIYQNFVTTLTNKDDTQQKVKSPVQITEKLGVINLASDESSSEIAGSSNEESLDTLGQQKPTTTIVTVHRVNMASDMTSSNMEPTPIPTTETL